jgi:hypothetical protein
MNTRMTRKENVSPFNDLATTSTARVTADERASGKILAENLLENIKKIDYASSYDVPVPDEFARDSAAVTVENVRNHNIQPIFITIERRNRQVLTLESYKVNRQ